jgi:integrase/recombinase XerD
VNIDEFITKFESYLLTEKRVSENTFLAYKQDLNQFRQFCKDNDFSLEHIDFSTLQQFLSFLKKRGISARSQSRKITTIKGLFSYGASRYGFADYAQELHSPKLKQALPEVLSEDEVMRLFVVAEQDNSSIGKRNTVMMYLMYVTGMRVTELISLKITDVHRDKAVVAIEGKGGRQRMVPIPEDMMVLLCHYIDDTRMTILNAQVSDCLFPIRYGKKIKAITRQGFWLIVKLLWKKAAINRPMSPHTLRHSFATHMLQKGANLRSLQLLLGHEQLTTVQVYTHIDTNYLRGIYNKKHPRSK